MQVIYMHKDKLYNNIKDYKNCYDAQASIEYVIEGDQMLISCIRSFKPGYGSFLLYKAAQNAIKLGVIQIHADDMSDRYREDNNIYSKFRFLYMYPDGGPEMYVDPKDIVDCYDFYDLRSVRYLKSISRL